MLKKLIYRRRVAKSIPKYVPSLSSFLFYFYLGLVAFFLNLDYFALNEESFLALNSLGFFLTLGFVVRKQTGRFFFARTHKIFRVFRYVYRIGFRWLRKSVRVAAIGQWYVKYFIFSVDFSYRAIWRSLLNRLCRQALFLMSQQLAFFFLTSVFASKQPTNVAVGPVRS